MYYYKYNQNYLFSKDLYTDLEKISPSQCFSRDEIIYFLGKLDPEKSKDSFCLSCPSLMDINEETLDILKEQKYIEKVDYPIIKKIYDRKIKFINTKKKDWKKSLDFKMPKKWKINILALGDVGSTLLIGLKLLGKDYIKEIGIYDKSENNTLRWERE